ncbi:MAG: M48 family metallopeptidase [Armatimonadetes bacterium]|nr:M48 family metallopeptidase [Armatimonadota bacterium]
MVFPMLLALMRPARADFLDSLERSVGSMAAQALERNLGVWQGEQASALLASVAADQFSLRSRSMPYRLRILDSPRVDALALPGGYIYVYRGLLAHASSVDELAGVLAHEMAHMENRDFQRLVLRQLLWLSVAGMARRTSEGAADAVLVAGVLNSLRHSRRQEAQADAAGLVLAGQAGYDPAGLKTFLDRLRPRSNPWLDRIFATHPDPENRSRAAERRMCEWLASNPLLAWRVFLALRGRGRPATALALARRCAAWPSHGFWARVEAKALEAEVRRLAEVRVKLPSRGQPHKVLLERLEALRDDQRIQQAFLVAQAIGPELHDWRYWGLLAAAVAELNRLGAVLDEGYEAEYRLRMVESKPNAHHVAKALVGARRAGLMLAAVLGELLATGRGQPLGELNSARAGLLLGQVRMAGAEIASAHAAVKGLLEAVSATLARNQLAVLSELSRQAPELIAPSLLLLSGRARNVETCLIERWLAACLDNLQDSGAKRQNRQAAGLGIGGEPVEDIYIVSRWLVVQAAGEVQLARFLCASHPAEGKPCDTPCCLISTAISMPWRQSSKP